MTALCVCSGRCCKCYKRSWSHNRNLLFHRSGRWKSKVKVSAEPGFCRRHQGGMSQGSLLARLVGGNAGRFQKEISRVGSEPTEMASSVRGHLQRCCFQMRLYAEVLGARTATSFAGDSTQPITIAVDTEKPTSL